MCLIAFAYKSHPDYPLIVAANRDEYLDRDTAPVDFWQEHPGVLAGRDLKAGGTWMGISKTGRFAAITNYRDPSSFMPEAPSRGALVTQFLKERSDSGTYLDVLASQGSDYNGFNLLAYDGLHLGYLSNTNSQPFSLLSPGVYGLSNHLLDTPWPKVSYAKSHLEKQVLMPVPNAESALAFLRNKEQANDGQLPSTGVPLELERALSAAFIRFRGYGTRCSTFILYGKDGKIDFTERTFDVPGAETETRKFRLERIMHE